MPSIAEPRSETRNPLHISLGEEIIPHVSEGSLGEVLAQLTKVLHLQMETKSQISQLTAGQKELLQNIRNPTMMPGDEQPRRRMSMSSPGSARRVSVSWKGPVVSEQEEMSFRPINSNSSNFAPVNSNNSARNSVRSASAFAPINSNNSNFAPVNSRNSARNSVRSSGSRLSLGLGDEQNVPRGASRSLPNKRLSVLSTFSALTEADYFLLSSQNLTDSSIVWDEVGDDEDDHEDEEVKYELHPAWQQDKARASTRLTGAWTKKASYDIFASSSYADADYQALDPTDRHLITRMKAQRPGRRQHSSCKALLSKMMFSPSSNALLLWSIFEAALLFYDMLAVPASLLDPPPTRFDDSVKWIALLFWTMDMPACCFKGFITKHGDVEMSFGKVARKYLRFDFGVDLILLVIEYVNFIMWLQEPDDLQMHADVRFIRVLRFSRLLKVSKFRRLVRRLVRQVSSLAMVTMIYTCGELIGIVLLCHAGACIWYAIGDNNVETLPLGAKGMDVERRWIRHERSTTFAYRYMTCLQWAVSQLGYGGIDIYPTNTGERIFSCVFTLVCMVSLCLWLAALVSSFTSLKHFREQQLKETDNLREYLRMYKVHYSTRNRIWKVLRELEDETMLLEQDIEYCKDLPKPLALELRVEVFIPHLTKHPFFGTYGVSDADKNCMQRLMRGNAVQHARLQPKENLFLPGDIGQYMYFIMTGCVDYHWNGIHKQLHPQSWVSEVCLWLRWWHNGYTSTQKRCELVTLQAEEFQSIMSALPEAHRYATIFYSFAQTSTEGLSDSFPDAEVVAQMAMDTFSPQTYFCLPFCQPKPEEWYPSVKDWQTIWKSTWAPSHLLSSAAMMRTMHLEMKHDILLVFQTLFSQNCPAKQPFSWGSVQEQEAYDIRIMFLKRFLLLLALCNMEFTDEENTPHPWPFPLAATVCHGGRTLLQLQNITWKDMLHYLLWGEDADSHECEPPNIPFPFYMRRAGTHGVVMNQDTLSLREVKLSGLATLSPNHLGMDVPVGGLGNPMPLHEKQGDLFVGPAGVPYRYDNPAERGSGRIPSLFEATGAGPHINYVHQIQHGHIYVRFDDFGQSETRRLSPVLLPGNKMFDRFDVKESNLKAYVESNPSKCFNGLSLAHMAWEPVEVLTDRDLVEVLRLHNLEDASHNEDKMKRLMRLIADNELILEEKTGGDELRCRGNMLHVVFHLRQEGMVLVQTHASATEEKLVRNRAAFAELKDIRIPTVVCRHDHLWTSVLSLYCKTEFGLSELAAEYIVKSCEDAKLYSGNSALSVSFCHADACSDGVPLDYEVLQLTVHIDAVNRHLFDPLLSDPDGHVLTTAADKNLCGFAHLQTTGDLSRAWKWMSQDELALVKVKGLQAPKSATKLDLLTESLSINSLLIGIESCAPLKEDIFGNVHGVDGRKKSVSAFGKRKWKDYNNGGQAVPAEIGGIRVVVDMERFAYFKRVCSEIKLCKPSQSFLTGTALADELTVFQHLLRDNDHAFLRTFNLHSL